MKKKSLLLKVSTNLLVVFSILSCVSDSHVLPFTEIPATSLKKKILKPSSTIIKASDTYLTTNNNCTGIKTYPNGCIVTFQCNDPFALSISCPPEVDPNSFFINIYELSCENPCTPPGGNGGDDDGGGSHYTECPAGICMDPSIPMMEGDPWICEHTGFN